MDDFEVEWVEQPALDEPVLVEGLPGVGHVGKLAAEYLVEELDGDLVCRVYSTHFPHRSAWRTAGRLSRTRRSTPSTRATATCWS